MNTPEWIKPALAGAAIGGVAVAVVGFTWGGWVTSGSAQASSQAAADASRTDLAAAICVQKFLADEGARENLEELRQLTSSTQQRTYIENGNWAVMPGSDTAVRPAATLCARMVSELEPLELPVVEGGEVIEEGEVIESEVVDVGPATPEPAPAPADAPAEVPAPAS